MPFGIKKEQPGALKFFNLDLHLAVIADVKDTLHKCVVRGVDAGCRVHRWVGTAAHTVCAPCAHRIELRSAWHDTMRCTHGASMPAGSGVGGVHEWQGLIPFLRHAAGSMETRCT
jgi:hypothetical protein